MPELLSEWRVRQRLEDRGVWTNHDQFVECVEWGFLGEPIEGKWPEETVGRIEEIHAQGLNCRPMSRRVFRLHDSNLVIWAPPPTRLRRALSDVAGSKAFNARKRKLARLNGALERIGAQLAAERVVDVPGWLRYRPVGPRPKRAWTKPLPDDWRALITDEAVSDTDIRDVVDLSFHWDAVWGARFADVWPSNSIVVEERIALLAVRQLSIERGWREQTRVAARDM